METLNITYNFLTPIGFALVIRLLTYVCRGRDPYGALNWTVCGLPRYAYAALGTLSLVGQFFNGPMAPSMHLHALFMGWLVGVVILHMPGLSRNRSWSSRAWLEYCAWRIGLRRLANKPSPYR